MLRPPFAPTQLHHLQPQAPMLPRFAPSCAPPLRPPPSLDVERAAPLTGSQERRRRREKEARLLGNSGLMEAYREGALAGLMAHCRQYGLL